MHRTWSSSAARLLSLSAVGLTLAACEGSPTAPEAMQRDLDIVRAATARYQDVAVALREGFVAQPVCVAAPFGAMGIHYFNAGRVDRMVIAEEPEVLLYVREGGELRLVAIEYVVPVFHGGAPYFGSAAPVVNEPAPTMFGQTFQGPMPGHHPGMSWHYDLHVWLFRENPAGVFEQFNRAVSCSS